MRWSGIVPGSAGRHRQRLSSYPANFALAAGALMVALVLAWSASKFTAAVVVAVPVIVAIGFWSLHRPVVIAALVPFALPFGEYRVPGVAQVAQVLPLAVVGAVVVVRLTRGQAPLPAPPGTGWLLGFAGLVSLSVLFAADVDLAARQALVVVVSALFVLAIVGACDTFADVRILTGLLVLSGIVIGGSALTQTSSVSGVGGATVVSGATGIFSEHNQLGSVTAASLMISVGYVVGARSVRSAVLGGLGSVVSLVALGLALSRGAYIGAALGAVVFVVLLPQARHLLKVLALPMVGLLGVLVALAPYVPALTLMGDRLLSVTDATANPYDARPLIWAEAFRQIALHPLTGSGAGNYPVVALRALSPARFVHAEHAHNVLLTVAAEVGLPAVAVMILLSLLWTRQIARTTRRLAPDRNAAIVAGLGAALATFVGHGLVDVTLRSPVVMLLLCTCLGLALAAVTTAERELADKQVAGVGLPDPTGQRVAV